MIDRRAFLRRLGFGTVAAAAAAVGVFDVERLLWVPGEKTIFVPTFAPHTFASVDWAVRESLLLLQTKLQMVALVNRHYDWEESRRPDPAFLSLRVPSRAPRRA